MEELRRKHEAYRISEAESQSRSLVGQIVYAFLKRVVIPKFSNLVLDYMFSTCKSSFGL